MSNYSLFIMISGGDANTVWATDDLEHALSEVRMAFLDSFFDSQRGRILKGDIILAGDENVSTDFRLVRVNYFDSQETTAEVEIPFQSWIDEALVEAAAEQAKEAQVHADPEWAEYQRLSKKFRGC